ncbi:hypothetical protein [Bosea sp. NBC_00550]|uniref:hypothetical protein n=1 Tax=Bosea sp. NBC_00550 TaxID=2969621 RepID=UPI00222E4634|nr:hypothetical protein [Bosea sp. NBC_00550]UZF93413.1 hypothetical protein NWE53_04185 [Bosea sp. NBC_00550]
MIPLLSITSERAEAPTAKFWFTPTPAPPPVAVPAIVAPVALTIRIVEIALPCRRETASALPAPALVAEMLLKLLRMLVPAPVPEKKVTPVNAAAAFPEAAIEPLLLSTFPAVFRPKVTACPVAGACWTVPPGTTLMVSGVLAGAAKPSLSEPVQVTVAPGPGGSGAHCAQAGKAAKSPKRPGARAGIKPRVEFRLVLVSRRRRRIYRPRM